MFCQYTIITIIKDFATMFRQYTTITSINILRPLLVARIRVALSLDTTELAFRVALSLDTTDLALH